MSIEIKNAKESAKEQGLTMLLYAKPKTGKTQFLSTIKNGRVLVLDFEKGWGVLKNSENIDILEIPYKMENWREVWEFAKATEDYDYICVDSLTEMIEAMKRSYRELRDGRLQLQDYDAIYNKTKDVMRMMRDFRSKGISVIVLAHEQQIKEQQDDLSLMTTTHPMVPEKIVSNIEGLFDVIARMEISDKKEKKGVRFLRLDRSKTIIAGNRYNNKKICIADMEEFLKDE